MVLKIVTSVYELNYGDERGGYKSYPLLTQTLRNIIFDNYEYVIYTNKHTYEKHRIFDDFDYPNVEIKFHELNSDYYVNNINPIRINKFLNGEIFERIYCVENYIEVIFNKIKFLLDECKENNNVIWIDSGLFGTSCHDKWRDYINEIAHSELFLSKINQKIDIHKFICLRGEGIMINYELMGILQDIYKTNFKLISGGLFGGTSKKVKEVLSNYLEIFEQYYKKTNALISEQEILSILTHKNDVKFFNFGDWTDLQRGILQLMDLYEIDKYKIDQIYEVKI